MLENTVIAMMWTLVQFTDKVINFYLGGKGKVGGTGTGSIWKSVQGRQERALQVEDTMSKEAKRSEREYCICCEHIGQTQESQPGREWRWAVGVIEECVCWAEELGLDLLAWGAPEEL